MELIKCIAKLSLFEHALYGVRRLDGALLVTRFNPKQESGVKPPHSKIKNSV